MRPGRLLPLAALLGAVLPAAATLVVPMDLTELVADADVVVVGRVTDARAFEAGGRTETVITLAVIEYLKGTGGSHVAFRVPGGQVGRYRTIVIGAPSLDEGDDVVAFLTGQASLRRVVGFSQGILRVFRQATDGAPMVLAPPAAAATGSAQRVVRGEQPRRFMTLKAFLDDVRALADHPRAVEGR